ncbi:dTDP-4-dehydrorhamnose reductase [Rhizobiales bacterium GAS188]|nr:dTDP-4-dehydrorhamnose reductase [Rhizobiales bacterium GAS188]
MGAVDILVTGGTGQLGLELQRFAWPDGVRLHAPGRETLDLASPDAIARLIAARPFAVVINAAAYTAVDKAESEVAAAWTLNALAPAVLAAETAKAKIPLLHVSTDYVFSGSKTRPYVEDDPVGPLGVYGASKEGGEQAVRSANPRSVIIRTAWVVSEHRANFVKTVLRLANERDRLTIVADQQGCPTSARDLASALAMIALRLASDPAAPLGTFHVTNAGETSWHGLACEVVRLAFEGRRGAPIVHAITTADYPTPARRPMNSRLANAKVAEAYGVALRPWQEAVAEIVSALR